MIRSVARAIPRQGVCRLHQMQTLKLTGLNAELLRTVGQNSIPIFCPTWIGFGANAEFSATNEYDIGETRRGWCSSDCCCRYIIRSSRRLFSSAPVVCLRTLQISLKLKMFDHGCRAVFSYHHGRVVQIHVLWPNPTSVSVVNENENENIFVYYNLSLIHIWRCRRRG